MSLVGGNANALLTKKEFGFSFPMCDNIKKIEKNVIGWR